MVIGNSDAANAAGGANNMAHPSGIPQEKIDNIMSGIANTGDVKMNNHRKKLRQRFDIIKKLGQGTYGKVQLGINKETGQEVAIKTIKKCKIEAEADLVRIRREVQIMSSVQHPNIIHIYEVFENREKMVLVMEFAAGGELYDYLSERKVLSEEEACRIFRQVATAVYYCHKHKICHRDLKLENILLDDQGNAKIADFGLSNVFDDQRLLATFCGSPLYASPEIVEGTPYQGPEVDCWSLGVLLYTLVYGSMPFDGSNFKRLVKQISEGDYYEPKKPSRASSLIREMLTVCPRKRATIEQICAHWWVNENDNKSCLDLAEDLANRTPVRLDVLLSLTPAAITADQLVVPSADGSAAGKGSERVPRSHSVGSIREMGANTEAERRILDMVAAGGEAALMPSPTRTITPAQSPVQSKRKLENTVSTENAAGLLKKKEKAGSSALVIDEDAIAEEKDETLEPMPMETDEVASEDTSATTKKSTTFTQLDMQNVSDICTQLIQNNNSANVPNEQNSITTEPTLAPVIPRQKTIGKLDSVEEAPEEKDAAKVIKKFVNKHKTADLVNAIGQANPEQSSEPAYDSTSKKPAAATTPQFVRKCSLQDEAPLNKFNDRRKSRILETAEKFQQMNANNGAEKPKKFVLPGVSVGSYKKEFERKAVEPAAPPQGPTAGELRALEQVAAAAAAEETAPLAETTSHPATLSQSNSIEGSDSKNSMTNFSLDEARRSMENSIALLRQAQHESSKEVDQLCAKTESIGVHDEDPMERERERKLKNARAIIGNAIQPASPSGDPNPGTVKTSTAQITLKSATLPRRKTAKTEIQLDIKPRIVEQSPMRFTTEMQHPVADLRSAPAREGPLPFSPVTTGFNTRATSLEPKEHIIPIQRPQMVYTRTGSNTTTKSGGSLSRQSTLDSESDTTTNTNMSQSTVTGSSQPIKKSPREFIIPIAVEGGGFITPREGSIEPSESSHTASSRSTFSRIRPTRRIGSLLNDSGIDEGLPFHKMRTASINRDADDDSRFTLHKLRSSRPVKKISQDNDESQSSGEEDDDDGFEILTAENLFSTLLQRVRALTNRLNVNNDIPSGFPNSSRLLNNLRQGQSSFWNQEPFGSRLNNTSNATGNLGAPWRHSMSRDLGSDMDSMFSRTGATLPRGNKSTKAQRQTSNGSNTKTSDDVTDTTDTAQDVNKNEELFDEPLDLADLDLSRLRLSKKDLETLSSITPGLPKCFQEQLLAKLPPTQARKLSRTLSMQNSPQTTVVRVHKRSQSGGRDLSQENVAPNDLKEEIVDEGIKTTTIKKTTTQTSTTTTTVANKTTVGDDHSDRSSSLIYRRSMSRTRYDYDSVPTSTETTTNSRSNSVCRDDYGKSLCSSYSSDISDKYKYYSPYLSKSTKETSTDSGSVSPQKRYGSVSPRESSHSPNISCGGGSGTLGRPPSGALSPPLLATDNGSSSLRRRSSQRRISRFLRPDFFEEPVEENPYQREKKQRERETQSVLREIREKSRESSRDRLSHSSHNCDELLKRKHSLPNEDIISPKETTPCHVRNKSMDTQFDTQADSHKDSSQDTLRRHRRSLSRPKILCVEMDKNELADKILEELQILSAVKSQQEQRLSASREVATEQNLSSHCTETPIETETVDMNSDEYKEKTSTVRKVKKIKPKEKLAESNAETDAKATTIVIKKVKKIVKKTESTKAVVPEDSIKSQMEDSEKLRPESKLKRPKSYPTKEPTPASLVKAETTTATALPSRLPMKSSSAFDGNTDPNSNINKSIVTSIPITLEPRENRLVRPKSYPASKLTPPKETKKITRSGIAIPSSGEQSASSRQPTSEEQSATATPIGKTTGSIDTSSSSESRPNSVKKIPTIKVTKKSKLIQPTVVASPQSTSEDLSPQTLSKQLKEKSPDKKIGKGLLYAIGQKFEKLRDSAMNKDKKSTSSTSSSSTTNVSAKRSSPDRSSPEKTKIKTKIIKKKKSADSTTVVTNEETNVTPGFVEATANETSTEQGKPVKTDKRSRIDAMIRSLRERSVPRNQPPATESHYITRAVSVEEMPGTFNRNAVNKVLGLFKRFEKDGSDRKVRSTRSTSNIERHMHGSPSSPIYQNIRERPRSGGSIAGLRAEVKSKPSANILATSTSAKDRDLMCDCNTAPPPQETKTTCTDCLQVQSACALIKHHDETPTPDHKATPQAPLEQSQANREKRKALMLDLVKLEKLDNSSSACSRSNNKSHVNGNGIYSNLPPYPGAQKSCSQHNENVYNNNNNNSITNNNNNIVNKYRTSSAHEINRNHMFTPSSENIANYSSDSRSYQDDCASTSTFMSPTDEPELYFDNWSVCSEDNYMLTTPSPTVSRLSRVSQFSSPSRTGDISDPNESVIDRIKRRSFYCRFNDKKPKRTSSIVGPTAVRDYYREQQAAVKSRANNHSTSNSNSHKTNVTNSKARASSPDITQQFFRPLKLSPVGTELKPPIYKAPHDLTTSSVNKPRKSLNDIRPTTSPSFNFKRYGSSSINSNDNDYLSLTTSAVPTRMKTSSASSSYESNGGYYTTYNPKRRSSYTLNGVLPNSSNTASSHHIDGYATVGRRTIRPYDQRTMSLLEPPSASSSSFRREPRTPLRDYTSSISRSNSHYRTSSSSTRSPTNI